MYATGRKLKWARSCIGVISVVHPGVTKFSTHEIFHTLRSAVYTHAQILDQQRFVMALFHYLLPIDSVLDTQGILSQAVPCVLAN